MKTLTTSVRLPVDMSEQLNKAALILHRGKNWIIAQAITRYLADIKPLTLAEEAKRQSILASTSSSQEDDIWENYDDTEDWR